jgi:hypothetical protein
MTGNIIHKLPCRLTGVLTCFVQRKDFDRAEIQVCLYERHLSATGGRLFVVLLLSTPTDPAGHFYHSEPNILVGDSLYLFWAVNSP